jgi:hypothetical protein
VSAAGFPDLLVQIAFASAYNDTTPDWVDVTGYCQSLNGQRGRQDERSICEPGAYQMVLRNTDGIFNPDNSAGTYYGQLRPNKRVRIGATILSTYYPIFTGWTEAFHLSPDQQTCTVTAVDRFGLLSRQKDTLNSRPDEYADVRITALLQHFGIGSADRDINADALAARTLATHDYEDVFMLDALQNAAVGDGGLLFMDVWGLVNYQTVRFRQAGGGGAAMTSQATFCNDDPSMTGIPVQGDLTPKVDRSLMANRVTITDCNGDEAMAEDTALQAAGDGLMELELGDSLLLASDAQDRVDDELALRKNPIPRVEQMTVDVLACEDTQQALVLERELSDRITLAIIPPGLTSGTSRDQFVEGVGHDIQIVGDSPSWTATFRMSSTGDAAVEIP